MCRCLEDRSKTGVRGTSWEAGDDGVPARQGQTDGQGLTGDILGRWDEGNVAREQEEARPTSPGLGNWGYHS